ncbi:MAG: lipoate protein ligase C-terminal domain-containing protein, partial [Dehalococcoidia bacterium]|nr:lipoate protein ligase C-terminal domain-containing protein [Dehalococcoidia bacterium]
VSHKAEGGLIRATARICDNRIDDISLSGDFFIHPPHLLTALERVLRGEKLEEGALGSRLTDFYATSTVQSPGVVAEDWTAALLLMRSEAWAKEGGH